MNSDSRRQYWIEQMNKAYHFMMDVSAYPVEESNEKMVSIEESFVGSGAKVVFSDKPFPMGMERVFYLREGLIEPIIEASKEFNQLGLMIKFEDAYRSSDMQREIALCSEVLNVILNKVIWELNGDVPSADYLLKRISALSATFPKVGTHMSGSALDISIVSIDDLEDLDRGGKYIELSELTPMASPFISEEARSNREKISVIMAKFGFIPYKFEFWHYSKGDIFAEYLSGSNKTAIYGPINFDYQSGDFSIIENPMDSLHDLDHLKDMIDSILIEAGSE